MKTKKISVCLPEGREILCLSSTVWCLVKKHVICTYQKARWLVPSLSSCYFGVTSQMAISHFTHPHLTPIYIQRLQFFRNTWVRLKLWATSIVVSRNKTLGAWEKMEIEAVKTRAIVFHAVHLFHELESRQWT